jgi:AraC family transcriptional regulator
MNGYDCITGLIDLFEQQIAAAFSGTFDPLATEKLRNTTNTSLAARSGYSFWHFMRLFSAVTGMTPKEYISARIMSESAAAIARLNSSTGNKTLSAVAYRAGFDSYETFSRSFRRQFGIPPAQLKKEGTLECIAPLLIQRFHPHPRETAGTVPAWTERAGIASEIVLRQPFHLTGISFYLDKKKKSFDQLWAVFSAKQHLIGGRFNPEQFCQYTAWSPAQTAEQPDEALFVLCALMTRPETVQEPVFTSRMIPGGKFLHCIHEGSIETISDTYERIYRGFVAESTLSFPASWEYQTYTSQGRTDIYIPINA